MLSSSFCCPLRRMGREYDGGGESSCLVLRIRRYLVGDSQRSTDGDLENIARVVAHEYFHNWTGNRVTCRDWFQLTLKEGLTVFRDQQFSADVVSSPGVQRIDEVCCSRLDDCGASVVKRSWHWCTVRTYTHTPTCIHTHTHTYMHTHHESTIS